LLWAGPGAGLAVRCLPGLLLPAAEQMLVEGQEEQAALQDVPQPECFGLAEHDTHPCGLPRGALLARKPQHVPALVGALELDDRVADVILLYNLY